jgi:hypothetical protein
MKYMIGMLLSLALPLVPVGMSFAAGGGEIQSAVESRYRMTSNDLLGSIKEAGTVLVVQKEGLKAGRPVKLFNPNVVIDGRVATAGGGELPLRSDFDGYLKPGDRLYLYGVRTGNDYVDLVIFTVKSYSVSGSGTRGPVPLQANVRFRYDGGLAAVSSQQVMADIGAWFKTEEEVRDESRDRARSESKEKSGEKATGTVRLGQTEAEVTAILGAPEKKIILGTKSVFVYGNVKVIFIDGKVTDAE